ncbi:MAG TPA: hypothetical protein VM367_12325 [Pseudonocardia sp.]|nr:hypothetical protein [Pseudonocardia sp.]
MPGEPTVEILMPGGLAATRPRRPVRHDIRDSPLWVAGHSLSGRVVTDPREIRQVGLRVRWYAQPWWTRWRRCPHG